MVAFLWRPQRSTFVLSLGLQCLFQHAFAAYDWIQVAYISSYTGTTDEVGDVTDFSYTNSQMSDSDINAYDFSIVKFEPEDSAYPTTYFDFDGRSWASTTPSYPSDYALTESDALSGTWTSPSCNSYTVCNFGRGHCSGTVQSAMGYAGYGGCGSSPVIGTSGVTTGTVKVYIYADDGGPSVEPTMYPTPVPSLLPTLTTLPTEAPTTSFPPTKAPSDSPSEAPSEAPTPLPSSSPSQAPTPLPTVIESFKVQVKHDSPSQRDFNLGKVVPNRIPDQAKDEAYSTLKTESEL